MAALTNLKDSDPHGVNDHPDLLSEHHLLLLLGEDKDEVKDVLGGEAREEQGVMAVLQGGGQQGGEGGQHSPRW